MLPENFKDQELLLKALQSLRKRLSKKPDQEMKLAMINYLLDAVHDAIEKQ